MPQDKIVQLELPPERIEALERLIDEQYSVDSVDLEQRNKKFQAWYRLWRNGMEVNSFPNEEESNFSVPIILWSILQKLSKELDALLGEESEIVVSPIGKMDASRVEKIRRWMNWRIKNSLKLFPKLYIHLLQKLIFGTSISSVQWKTKTRLVKEKRPVKEFVQGPVDQQTGLPTQVEQDTGEFEDVEREIVEFDGPDLEIENLENLVWPVNARSVIDNDHLIRILNVTEDQLLDLREEGHLSDKLLDEDTLEKLKNFDDELEIHGQEIREEKDIQDNLPTEVPSGGQSEFRLYNCFEKFKIKESDTRTSEIVCYYSPDLRKVLGVARLVDMFPDGRRPLIESKAIQDVNRPLGIGLCELLEPISNEIDSFHNLAIAAGEGAIGPVVFYEEGSGFEPKSFKLEPYVAVQVADVNKIKVVNLGQINLQPYVLMLQNNMSFVERLTGLTSDQQGLQSTQPNAPRTFGQQALLHAESSIRLLLDIRLERENLRELLRRVWEMDKRFLGPETFFRVTEEDGGDVLTKEDMQGEFDFDIGPVTAISNRSQKNQELAQAFALSAQMGIPQISVSLFRKILEKLGQHDIAKMLPSMKDIAPPMNPDDENILMLQGQDVDPHPMDNNIQHIARHEDFKARMLLPRDIGLTDSLGKPKLVSVTEQNPGLIARIDSHIGEHQSAGKGNVAASFAPQAGGGLPPAGGGGVGGGVSPAGALQQNLQGQLGNPAQDNLNSILNQGGTNLG